MFEAIANNNGNSPSTLDIPSVGDAGLITIAEAWLSRWKADRAAGGADQTYFPSEGDRKTQREALLTIIETGASTMAGMRAKAAVLGCLDYNSADLAASLCADLNLMPLA